jgi:hypothetical protein
MVLLKIALLHLIVLVGRKRGEGLSDGLRKEHLIQSGDDIKKCHEYAVWLCSKPKSEILTMKMEKQKKSEEKVLFFLL